MQPLKSGGTTQHLEAGGIVQHLNSGGILQHPLAFIQQAPCPERCCRRQQLSGAVDCGLWPSGRTTGNLRDEHVLQLQTASVVLESPEMRSWTLAHTIRRTGKAEVNNVRIARIRLHEHSVSMAARAQCFTVLHEH